MAVTSQGKGRAKTETRARTMKRKSPVKRRNAPAVALADPRYRKREIKSSKAYSRKGKPRADQDDDA